MNPRPREPENDSALLERARDAFVRKAWPDAYRWFEAADRDGPLPPEDLERLAAAAYLLGRDVESEDARERAHRAYLDRGDREGAARSAGWLGFGLLHRGAMAPASGWFARAERILDEEQLDCVVRGYLLIPSGIQRFVQGDTGASHDIFNQIADIARRFGDRDLSSFACHGRGRVLIRLGKVFEGAALLDEAMVAVIAGDVSPVLAGDIYCSVLEACQETFDVRRAYEWSASLAEWCAAQAGLVRYRGECLLYRAEVMQLRGQWDAAATDAQEACTLLMSRPGAGAAFYRLGDIHRLRGDFEKAEEAYTLANERGRRPQPGLSLLRLEQGQVETAAASIRGVLVETSARPGRARVLVAAVEILIAAGDLEQARAAAAELSALAGAQDAPFLSAAAAHAAGAVLLAAGDIEGASRSLRQASDAWRELEMPYESAQSSLLLAALCERRGDQDGRRLELDSAQTLFTRLNAERCLARIGQHTQPDPREPAGPLSEREIQVLRLLAGGKTNRAIGEELFISDKTVARHVSNIFDKLGVSSRTAATAWAFQHNLV